jgi:hypothetical protein
MNIRIFNRKYTIRSFDEPININGHWISGYRDWSAKIHVHPSGGDNVTDNYGAGENLMRRLEGHGEIALKVSDRETGQKADMLFFDGHWYECISCEHWFHTLLNHFNYRFTLVQEFAEGDRIEFEPPIPVAGGG